MHSMLQNSLNTPVSAFTGAMQLNLGFTFEDKKCGQTSHTLCFMADQYCMYYTQKIDTLSLVVFCDTFYVLTSYASVNVCDLNTIVPELD